MQVVKLDITLYLPNYMQLYINDKQYPGLLLSRKNLRRPFLSKSAQFLIAGQN